MIKGVVSPLTVLAVALLLYTDLTESQCTTKYCEDHDEGNLLSMCWRNQEVVEELQHELRAVRVEHGRLQQEVNSLKEAVAKQGKYSADDRLLGTSRPEAARSCKHILDRAANATNGVYWICTSSNCSEAREVYCDMRSGGWTLIGQIGGVNGDIYDKWLVANENSGILRTPVIERGTYGCIDAVDLAINYAHQIRLSSGEKATGMGRNWVEWDLPADRDVDTFWRMSVGNSAVYASTHNKIIVRSSFASTTYCYQNKYGIIHHQGGYPGTLDDWRPGSQSIGPDTACMAVTVMAIGTRRYGFYVHNTTYLYQSPNDNDDWPSHAFNKQPPFVSVWLK